MIFNENCLDTMFGMPDGHVDLVLTSPPYDNLKSYEGYEFNFEAISVELNRILKPDGIIVWIVGDSTVAGSESGSSFKQALRFMDLGLKLHDTMIYEKNSSSYPARANSNRYTQIFEYMFIFAKNKVNANLICDKANKWAGHKDFSGKLKNPVPDYSPRTNIWKYTTSFNGWKHPAPFPLALAEDHIKSWTKENDLVYDPFMGSGTTAEAAKKLNRKWVGSEISSTYCKMIIERLSSDTPF